MVRAFRLPIGMNRYDTMTVFNVVNIINKRPARFSRSIKAGSVLLAAGLVVYVLWAETGHRLIGQPDQDRSEMIGPNTPESELAPGKDSKTLVTPEAIPYNEILTTNETESPAAGLQADCSAEIVDLITKTDLTAAGASAIFSSLRDHPPVTCQVRAIEAIAKRIDAQTDPLVMSEFGGWAATLSKFLIPAVVAEIKAAYQRFPYTDSIALSYFLGLRQNAIDIRDRLKDQVPEDWSFSHPRGQDAATWHYYLYLASLEDPAAFPALSQKIAATENGNDAANLLADLSQVKVAGVRQIIESYADDTRHTDGPNGPGAMISELVPIWLMNFAD